MKKVLLMLFIVFTFVIGMNICRAEDDVINSCKDYKKSDICENNGEFSCVWNKFNDKEFCNTDNLLYVKCGNAYDIPNKIPSIISFFINLLKIVAPITLIVISVITLLKALFANNEDEIKKAQLSLIKKVVAMLMVFLTISIVQFVTLKLAEDTEKESMLSCMSCFLNNDCSNSLYYKTNILGDDYCTYLYTEAALYAEDFEVCNED